MGAMGAWCLECSNGIRECSAEPLRGGCHGKGNRASCHGLVCPDGKPDSSGLLLPRPCRRRNVSVASWSRSDTRASLGARQVQVQWTSTLLSWVPHGENGRWGHRPLSCLRKTLSGGSASPTTGPQANSTGV